MSERKSVSRESFWHRIVELAQELIGQGLPETYARAQSLLFMILLLSPCDRLQVEYLCTILPCTSSLQPFRGFLLLQLLARQGLTSIEQGETNLPLLAFRKFLSHVHLENIFSEKGSGQQECRKWSLGLAQVCTHDTGHFSHFFA